MARVDELTAQIHDLQLRTLRTVPEVAAAMGRAFHDRLVNVTLRRYTHPMYVPTDAPPGGPPAFVSGELAYSVTMELGETGGGKARAFVGPHAFYAAVQEFGGEMHTEGDHYMRWYMTGLPGGPWWFRQHVTVPPRPYMQPTRDEMIADDSLHQAAVRAFLGGMEE